MASHPSPMFYAKVVGVLASLATAGYVLLQVAFALENRWNQGDLIEKVKKLEAAEQARIDRALAATREARRGRGATAGASVGSGEDHDHRTVEDLGAAAPADSR